MPLKRWYAERALLDHPAERVLIEVEGERLVAVTPDVDPPPDAIRLPGVTLPGLVNAHSHAFHRALRGRTHTQGSFWTWREAMYVLAGGLDPSLMYDLARATYAEMALAGITAVGEFHYLHHQPDGNGYADANAMGRALIAAATDAGIRITLLDTCYLTAGIGRPAEGVQRRSSDGDFDAWGARVEGLEDGPLVRVGAAIHSVRAVGADDIARVADWARTRDRPLHVHLSEQRAENKECLAMTGRTPTQLLAERGALGELTTAAHATHVSAADIELLGGARTSICACPTTERDLADGIGPMRMLAKAGSPLCLGSDSQAVIDLFEEARGVEMDERLATEQRGVHAPADLLSAATRAGSAALGWDAGRLEPGALADFITVSLSSPRIAGAAAAALVDQIVFAAVAADVTGVVTAGRTVVRQGRHMLVDDVGAELERAIGRAHVAAEAGR